MSHWSSFFYWAFLEYFQSELTLCADLFVIDGKTWDLEPWFVLWSFFFLSLYFISINMLSVLIWTSVEFFKILRTVMFRIWLVVFFQDKCKNLFYVISLTLVNIQVPSFCNLPHAFALNTMTTFLKIALRKIIFFSSVSARTCLFGVRNENTG